VGIVFKNNAKTTLSGAVNNSTTTIPVTEGSVFPAVNLSGAGTFFLLTLDDETNNEIVKVTSCSGASGNINLTVIRAQEGTTARAFASGDKAELRFTSGTIDEIRSDNTVHTNIFTTANNSTTDFTLSDEVANENDLVVFIDGVFQAHNSFSVSGTTLTLATAPESGRVVTVYSIKGSRSSSNVLLATMTGDNSDTTLTLPVMPINENSVQVFFDGVYQNKDSFSISGTTLTFGVAPPTGVAVEALIFTKLPINTASILSDTDADTKVQVEESSDEDKIRFDTAGSERMIIDSSGNAGLGTSSPASPLHIERNSSETNLIVRSNIGGSGSNIGGRLRLQLGAQDNSGSGNADTQAGDTLGQVMFEGQGTDYSYQGGNIKCVVETGDGDDNRSNQGTYMSFETINVGSVSPAEVMRITQTGNLKFNSGYGSVHKAYGVRAWAQINQTTFFLNGAGGISSAADLSGAGHTKINFSPNLVDDNYVVLGAASNNNNFVGIEGNPPSSTQYSTSSVDVRIIDASNVGQELTNGLLNIAVIR